MTNTVPEFFVYVLLLNVKLFELLCYVIQKTICDSIELTRILVKVVYDNLLTQVCSNVVIAATNSSNGLELQIMNDAALLKSKRIEGHNCCPIDN